MTVVKSMENQILWLDTELYSPASKFVRSRSDKYDITGLILLSMNIEIPVNLHSPCELRTSYYPLTIHFRRRTILTPAGYQLLRLSGPLSKVLREANKILEPYNIELQGK